MPPPESVEQRAAEAPARNISIGAVGAAGISSAIPLTLTAVRDLALDYEVSETSGQGGGEASRVITLSAGDEVVFNLRPTPDGRYLHAIDTRSPRARGPARDVVGRSTFGEAPAAQVMYCASQAVDGHAGFACSNGQNGRFWRVYTLPDGYDGTIDPFEAIDPDMAIDAKLVEMRWIAPRAGTP
jgi:hypothetical protein